MSMIIEEGYLRLRDWIEDRRRKRLRGRVVSLDRKEAIFLLPDDLILVDGFDACIIGTVTRYGQPEAVAYDEDMMIEQIAEEDGISTEEALDYFSYNIAGAHMGESNPYFVKVFPKS